MKRVRFADALDEEGRSVHPKTRRPRTLLPGPEQDDDDLEGELTEGYRGAADIEDLLDDGLQQGPIKTTNPLFSAANRAARRKELNKLACSESGSFLEDVAGAEVEYGVHAQNWDNSGVPLEPFNLNQEREAGYFDEDGNYVAYCEAESDDAWLESLPQGPENAQAEEDMVEKDRKVFHDQEPQLSADTLRGYKEGIVDLLHPGESVFGALRRLGGLEGRKRVSDLRKDLGAGPMSARSMSKGRTVPPENRNAFDRLTALSNILLVNGDYHVHGNSRELLQADLLQLASGIPSGRPPPMAAPEQLAASSSAAIERQGSRDTHGWRAFAAGLEAPGSGGAVQDGAAAQAVGGDAGGPAAAPADPEEDIFEGSSLVEQASTDGNAAANEEAIMKPEEATAALLDRSPSLTAEEETAIGTPLDASVQHHDPSEHATASLPGEQSCGPSSAETMDAEAVAAADSARQPSPSCNSVDTNMVFAEPHSAAADESAPMEGFEYDADSGYFYNSIIGAYYDPYNRLFGDAASGHWFSLKNGEYQVVA